MQKFLFKIRARLPSLIEDIWEWEGVEEYLVEAQRTRVAALQAASQSKCVCAGRWKEYAELIMGANNVPVQELCRDIMYSLTHGRSEDNPIIVLAGRRGGEGKSFFLKALFAVFGYEQVFSSPVPGNFPLLDLPGKRVVLLDDWRLNEKVLSLATQCLWFDGSPLPIARPQNRPETKGHMAYRGTAPIFMTTPLKDVERLEAAALAAGDSHDPNADMVYRRLKVFKFSTRVPKPSSKVPYCKRCFAQFLFENSMAYF
jgi:hypothetical protein